MRCSSRPGILIPDAVLVPGCRNPVVDSQFCSREGDLVGYKLTPTTSPIRRLLNYLRAKEGISNGQATCRQRTSHLVSPRSCFEFQPILQSRYCLRLMLAIFIRAITEQDVLESYISPLCYTCLAFLLPLAARTLEIYFGVPHKEAYSPAHLISA